jgi:hypothetical protein
MVTVETGRKMAPTKTTMACSRARQGKKARQLQDKTTARQDNCKTIQQQGKTRQGNRKT